ncbi:polysaccharide pyruvyl transferase family protein [Anaerosporobacter faecicola]|uniref:polysaccharide pyruvyl transferase family protein n=1 Tax=Anaerosporobacter faecicola TaxID=2718714 RepID=UPI00143BCA57|nr:polysaccharide pyruvyl transferase family protein [Anaerosporobacter faecicola]
MNIICMVNNELNITILTKTNGNIQRFWKKILIKQYFSKRAMTDKGSLRIVYDSLYEAIKSTETEYIWITSNLGDLNLHTLQSSIQLMNKDKLEYIVHDSKKTNNKGMKSQKKCSQIHTAYDEMKEFGIEIRYDLNHIIFRNPRKKYWFKERFWPLDTEYDVIRFFLEYATHGYMMRISSNDGYVQNTKQWNLHGGDTLLQAGRYLKDLYQYDLIEEIQIVEKYKELVNLQSCSKIETPKRIFKKISLDAILRSRKPNILLSIYSFGNGAGELLPIILANQLVSLDYHVYVHVMKHSTDENAGRILLNEGITILQTDSEEELCQFIEDFHISILNTHHQANQSMVASMYRNMPEIRAITRHIATTHGMYEQIDEKDVIYLLQYQFKDMVDQWVYVEENNLQPFRMQQTFALEQFVNIQEKEVMSILYDKINRESTQMELQNLCRLREGTNNIEDIARAYIQIYIEQYKSIPIYKVHKEEEKLDWKENVRTGKVKKAVTLVQMFPQRCNKSNGLEMNLRAIGENTGNLLFANAVRKQVQFNSEIYLNEKEISSNIDNTTNMVIPLANFIRQDKEGILPMCEKQLLVNPNAVTLIGLGAQNSALCNTPKELVRILDPDKIRFLKEISERSVSIGVRGEFTASCLEEMGIHNIRVIGCPSLFFELDGRFKMNKQPTPEQTVFCITGGNIMESRITEFAIRNHAKWVMQMGMECNEFLDNPITIPETMPQGCFPGIQLDHETIREYQKENAHIFFNLDDWDAYLKKNQFTFSFGSRFHGNIAALRNGIPALFIVHDSRTRELVETLRLPYIDYTTFSKIHHMEELISYCDYTLLRKSYFKLTKNYVDFLEENGVKHNFSLIKND